jgi:hypothetical protein
MTRAFAIAALLLISGCQRSISQQTEYMKGIVVTASPSPTPLYATYPVSAAFGPHAVYLSRAQRLWLLRIIHSKTYGPRRAKLRFAVLASRQVPLVVYVPWGIGNRARGGHVIGEGCMSEFDPDVHGLGPGSEVSCTAPTPLPVIP